ncbi:hypothetical protein [Phaeobacter gallaeciensis]|uniref:Uncharacterized protein n=1 Tax=Phaeobacter gallaeciensis TaxID=60890 RepID=A0ABD4XFT1_9RHOB|nr:hypothetical protein [Phaeobacter gallaeciensis]MDE4142962.1 hypothetical protein [Phaeobacter gallaeciensis]MDE4147082.1 hypothetical protein [Phaeobacter gallaeciensis]MDE4151403.1 hypothetical protein [Phaeobacter gallaeciensis]MDE4155591.1 hypothetical protein [Phaeobacter gallaeciensis]MDE4159710.1 hypothetical protein [Phaeobacter gallaeciensis]
MSEQFSTLTTNYKAAIETAISDLEAKLEGAGFDAETHIATFEAISDAIAAFEAEGNSRLSEQFATLTSNYKAAIETAISVLEEKLQGSGVEAADFTTLANLAAALEALDTACAAALSEQFSTLTTNYEAAIETAISDLEAKLQGAGFDAETDPATFEAISDAIAALEAAGNTSLSEQFATLTSNYEAAIETAISALEQELRGAGDDAADFTTLAKLAAAIEALDTSGAAALSEQFSRLTTNYQAAI